MLDAESPLAAYHEAVRRHEARLKPGVRVRVMPGEGCSPGAWHGTIENGATGIIYHGRWIERDAPPHHNYMVLFDRPLRGRKTSLYCAQELMPLDTGAGAEDGEG